MAHSRGRVLLVDHDLLAEVAAIRGGLPDLRDVVVMGGPSGQCGYPRLDDLVEAASGRAPAPLVDDPGAPAKLMYTSGTTGVPKGVLWSRNCEMVWADAYGRECLPLEPGEAVYCCLPLFHITCQGTVLAALVRGGRVTVDRGFDPFGFWRRVRDADGVMFSFVGTILSVLARRPPGPSDIENPVRRILGSAAPTDRWREIEDRFGCRLSRRGARPRWRRAGRGRRGACPSVPGRWECRATDGTRASWDPTAAISVPVDLVSCW